MHNLCKLIKLITQISQGFGLFSPGQYPPSLPFFPPNSVYWCGQQTLMLAVVADELALVISYSGCKPGLVSAEGADG